MREALHQTVLVEGLTRSCRRCEGPIPDERRRDAIYCSDACRLQTNRDNWKERHPDRHQEAQQRYRDANREACNQRVRDFFARNPAALERKRKQEKQWLAENRDRVNENGRAARARKRAADPDGAYLQKKAQHLRSHYGLSLAGYDQMMNDQGGRCAICCCEAESRFSFHVDHDHETGRIRGLLCKLCNPMLGLARENVETLRAAIDYLEA